MFAAVRLFLSQYVDEPYHPSMNAPLVSASAGHGAPDDLPGAEGPDRQQGAVFGTVRLMDACRFLTTEA
jgi:hypothetical protein